MGLFGNGTTDNATQSHESLFTLKQDIARQRRLIGLHARHVRRCGPNDRRMLEWLLLSDAHYTLVGSRISGTSTSSLWPIARDANLVGIAQRIEQLMEAAYAEPRIVPALGDDPDVHDLQLRVIRTTETSWRDAANQLGFAHSSSWQSLTRMGETGRMVMKPSCGPNVPDSITVQESGLFYAQEPFDVALDPAVFAAVRAIVGVMRAVALCWAGESVLRSEVEGAARWMLIRVITRMVPPAQAVAQLAQTFTGDSTAQPLAEDAWLTGLLQAFEIGFARRR